MFCLQPLLIITRWISDTLSETMQDVMLMAAVLSVLVSIGCKDIMAIRAFHIIHGCVLLLYFGSVYPPKASPAGVVTKPPGPAD